MTPDHTAPGAPHLRPPRLHATFGGEALALFGDASEGYLAEIANWDDANAPFLAALQRLPPDTACLDIGANIGLTTCLLARRVSEGRVYAFEAIPRTVAMLRRNIAANHVAHAEVIEAALADQPGILALNEPNDAAGSHAISDARPEDAANVVHATALTVDGWAATRPDLGRIGFIKLDVEGFEPQVLAGAAQLIARDRPLILMEFNAWCLNGFHATNPIVFLEHLVRCFKVEMMVERGRFEPIDNPRAILHTNLVAHACVSDLLLRPIPGHPLPPLATLTGAPAHRSRHD